MSNSAWLGLFGVTMLMISGCVDSHQETNAAAPVPTAKSVGGEEIAVADDTGVPDEKETKLPDLPEGAGPLDKEPPKKFLVTKSGLKYRVLRKGKGEFPRVVDTVKVHYHGWLDSGKVFDSSYERGQFIEFPLMRVIKGWTEGMQHVQPGGMLELEIPAKLGYGDRGAGENVPGGATLHFLVELISVSKM